MGEAILQLGVGGIFALMVIKAVFDYLKSRKNGNSATSSIDNELFIHVEDQKIEFKLVREISEHVKWLKDIHNVKDEDGLPVWYVRRSLEEAMIQLAKNIEVQTKVMETMIMRFDSIQKNQ